MLKSLKKFKSLSLRLQTGFLNINFLLQVKWSLDTGQEANFLHKPPLQLVNNLNLTTDTKKLNELIAYLQDIFTYTDEEHKKILQRVQLMPKPLRKCSITVIRSTDLSTESGTAAVANRFFVTAEFESTTKNSGSTAPAGTSIKEEMCWNEALHL